MITNITNTQSSPTTNNDPVMPTTQNNSQAVSIENTPAMSATAVTTAPTIDLPDIGNIQGLLDFIQSWAPVRALPNSNDIFGSLNISSIALLSSYLTSLVQSSVFQSMSDISQAQTAAMDESNKQKIENINKSIEANQKAKKSGTAGEVLGWIATSLSVVAAVITLQPALIAAAVIMVTMQCLSQAKVNVPSEVTYTLTALSVVLSLGACFPGTMAKGGAALKVFFESLRTSGITLAQSAPKLFALLQLSGAVSGVTQAGISINTAVLVKKESDIHVEIKEMEALLLLLQNGISQHTDLVDRLVETFKNLFEIFAHIGKESVHTAQLTA